MQVVLRKAVSRKKGQTDKMDEYAECDLDAIQAQKTESNFLDITMLVIPILRWRVISLPDDDLGNGVQGNSKM